MRAAAGSPVRSRSGSRRPPGRARPPGHPDDQPGAQDDHRCPPAAAAFLRGGAVKPLGPVPPRAAGNGHAARHLMRHGQLGLWRASGSPASLGRRSQVTGDQQAAGGRDRGRPGPAGGAPRRRLAYRMSRLPVAVGAPGRAQAAFGHVSAWRLAAPPRMSSPSGVARRRQRVHPVLVAATPKGRRLVEDRYQDALTVEQMTLDDDDGEWCVPVDPGEGDTARPMLGEHRAAQTAQTAQGSLGEDAMSFGRAPSARRPRCLAAGGQQRSAGSQGRCRCRQRGGRLGAPGRSPWPKQRIGVH